ncbi:MAG TPA: nuclear transport factor 2 family protein [Ktedonosporobacter sp.]|nr:nuclear transport factor 2 family protein [Ktedonosporobacter sp.]
MSQHPFRVLSEGGASSMSSGEMAALLAPDVTFHSPILSRAVSGRERVQQILANAFEFVDPIQFTLELSDRQQTVFLWNGAINGYEIQAARVISENAEGQIYDISVLMRPYPVVTLFQQAMRERAGSTVPEEYWELAPSQ